MSRVDHALFGNTNPRNPRAGDVFTLRHESSKTLDRGVLTILNFRPHSRNGTCHCIHFQFTRRCQVSTRDTVYFVYSFLFNEAQRTTYCCSCRRRWSFQRLRKPSYIELTVEVISNKIKTTSPTCIFSFHGEFSDRIDEVFQLPILSAGHHRS